MAIESADYWNDEAIEEAKGSFTSPDKCWQHLVDTGLLTHHHKIASQLDLNGIGLEIGAGVCWASALLLNIPRVRRMIAVDISETRLMKYAPEIVRSITWHTSLLQRIVCDFNELPLQEASIDFIWMCQAFHHSDKPLKLLRECRRVLKPKGQIIVCGEEPVSFAWREMARWNLIQVDTRDGDHFYTMPEYRRMLDPKQIIKGERYTAFVSEV